MASPAVEDYLKTIYALSRSGDAVATSALAERLGVSGASVTGMLKQLAAAGLVDHAKYQGARLTEAGRLIAVETIRHHRSIHRTGTGPTDGFNLQSIVFKQAIQDTPGECAMRASTL